VIICKFGYCLVAAEEVHLPPLNLKNILPAGQGLKEKRKRKVKKLAT
jgi:hypothetical protein